MRSGLDSVNQSLMRKAGRVDDESENYSLKVFQWMVAFRHFDSEHS
jgi:hypothetical protein